jgi:hypothetical protein
MNAREFAHRVIEENWTLARFRETFDKFERDGGDDPKAREMLRLWERDWYREHDRCPCSCCERRCAEWRVSEAGLWICADCFPPPRDVETRSLRPAAPVLPDACRERARRGRWCPGQRTPGATCEFCSEEEQ